MTAIISSRVVINAPDATAGSIFIFLKKDGINTPKKEAIIIEINIAPNTAPPTLNASVISKVADLIGSCLMSKNKKTITKPICKP